MPAMNAGANNRVRVEFPADTINMVIARSVAAAIAARADLTLDQVEDVRLAMDEATSHLIKVARTGSPISCDLWIEGGTVHAAMTCATATPTPPDPDPFAWTVLTALVNTVDIEVNGSQVDLRWSLASDHSLQP
jgi:serine/threonine-protein kinase RsbW